MTIEESPENPANSLVRAHNGMRIPGGCDHCDAVQEVQADHHGPGIHALTIHHENWCPVLAVHAGNRAERRRRMRGKQ